jgi:hypothetical protein
MQMEAEAPPDDVEAVEVDVGCPAKAEYGNIVTEDTQKHLCCSWSLEGVVLRNNT